MGTELAMSGNSFEVGPFLERLKEFRDEFPMCYIEAWTPQDFEQSVMASVDDEQCLVVADELYQCFDAHIGTQWSTVSSIVNLVCDTEGVFGDK